MSITKIRVYSHIDLFGREATARDVELYNEWLEGKLQAEYPGAEIKVLNEQSLTRADVFVNGEHDACSIEADDIERFLQYCWDTCPWDFDSSSSNEPVNATEIIDNDENSSILYRFFKARLIGCGGQCYSRIYIDLDDYSLFESVEASCNSWQHRDDGSLMEITADAGWGADLSEEELAWLEEDGVSDFGYQEWLNDVIEPAIQAALDYWHNNTAE